MASPIIHEQLGTWNYIGLPAYKRIVHNAAGTQIYSASVKPGVSNICPYSGKISADKLKK